MNVRILLVLRPAVLAMFFGLLLGCGPQNQAGGDRDGVQPVAGGAGQRQVDPHDVPLTDQQKQQLREETANFADAVSRIRQFRDVVQNETTDGLPANPFAAHQALGGKRRLTPFWQFGQTLILPILPKRKQTSFYPFYPARGSRWEPSPT